MKIQWKVTTVLQNARSGNYYAAGSYTSGIKGILYYLQSIGIHLTRSRLYGLKEPAEYLVPQSEVNNLVSDWRFENRLKAAKKGKSVIHVRIERGSR
jgi:hypothetical protein